MMKIYHLIIPNSLKPKPSNDEILIAKILMEYFESDARFIPRASSTTPDLLIINTHQDWEIKNIRGDGKRTIQNNLREADRQSRNVVIGLFRTKMPQEKAIGRIKECLRNSRVRLKSIIIITRSKKVLVIK